MTISKFAALCALCALFSIPSFAQLTVAPQGRLTLTSGTPVMVSDVVGATTIYYTPYVGNNIPINTSGSWAEKTFSQLTLTLNSTEQTGAALYDIFAFLNSGTVTIGVNCYAWGSPSPSSLLNRGTGAVVAIQQLNGIWVNTNGSFCLYNGTTQYNTIAANSATYLGTVYVPSAGGETSMVFHPTPTSGGTANILGLYNAYNRVRTIARNIDSGSAWTDTIAAWYPLRNSNGNSIGFVDGLQQSSVDAQAQINMYASSGVYGFLGLAFDDPNGGYSGGPQGLTSSTSSPYGENVFTFDAFQPDYGFHTIYAIQYATGSTVTFFNGGGTTEELKVELEM